MGGLAALTQPRALSGGAGAGGGVALEHFDACTKRPDFRAAEQDARAPLAAHPAAPTWAPAEEAAGGTRGAVPALRPP